MSHGRRNPVPIFAFIWFDKSTKLWYYDFYANQRYFLFVLCDFEMFFSKIGRIIRYGRVKKIRDERDKDFKRFV